MVRPTIYKIDLFLSLPKSTPLPSITAADSTAGLYDITAEFHYSLWPISIARLFPNFRRLYRRASLAAVRGGASFDAAIRTVRSLVAAMDLSLLLPEEVVFGVAQKLLLLSGAVAGDPSVDAAPVLPLRLRITASVGVLRPSAAAERESSERRRFMAAVAEAEARIRECRPAAKAAVEALEFAAAGSGDSQGSCPICLEKLTRRDDDDDRDRDRDDHDCDDGRFVRMECAHVYHRDCIVRWLENSHKCPLCGYAMPTDD